MNRLIRTDFHIHTFLSDCGEPEATFEAVVVAAQAAELEAIGISDHIYLPRHRERPTIARQALPREINGLRIYVGCEADMQSPTRAAIEAEFAATLDYVLISTSHLFDPGVERNFVNQPKSMASYMLDLMEGAIGLGFCDIIPHPLHVPACGMAFSQFVRAVDETRLRSVAQAAAAAGVAFECNPRFLREDGEAATWLWQLFLECGCTLAINSDSHHPAHIACRGPKFATEEELRAVGISEEHLFKIEERVTRALG